MAHTPAAGQRSVSTFGTHESHARRAASTVGKRGGDRAKIKAPEGAPPAEEHELQQEVNKAYKAMSKRYHPDKRVASASGEPEYSSWYS